MIQSWKGKEGMGKREREGRANELGEKPESSYPGILEAERKMLQEGGSGHLCNVFEILWKMRIVKGTKTSAMWRPLLFLTEVVVLEWGELQAQWSGLRKDGAWGSEHRVNTIISRVLLWRGHRNRATAEGIMGPRKNIFKVRVIFYSMITCLWA